MRRISQKLLAMLMALVMVVGMLPVPAFAATGTPVVVVSGSDYQASSSSTTMSNIATQIKKGYASPFGILMGGDYDAGTMYPNASHLTAVDTAIANAFPSITAANRIMIQGNHETYGRLSPDNNELLDDTGAYENAHYSVYAINYEDFGSASNGLKTYLDGKTGYTKPIFVITHQPLHETSRGDNTKAASIFNVLNSYEKLNIIFLFGHNHSSDYDDYLGGGAIYLKKGDSIKVAGGSTSTLNFTYMNCGYVGYSNSGADNGLTMTAFEIYEDEVYIKRYDANGLHNLKAKGVSVDGYAADTNIYGSAVLSLTDGTSTIKTLAETESGGSGDAGDSGDSGDSGSGDSNVPSNPSGSYTYELVTSIEAGEKYVIVGNDHPVALMDNNGSFGSQTVTISGTTLTSDVALTEWTISGTDNGTIISDAKHQLGYDNSAWGLVTGGTVEFDITANNGNFKVQMQRGYNNYNFYYDGTDWTDKSTSDHYVRLYKLTGTGSGGGSTVTPSGNSWVTVTEPDGGTMTYTYELATSITAGESYVIVGSSNPVALTASMGGETVNISGTKITSETALTEWTFSGTSSGTIMNGSNYLRYSSSNSNFQVATTNSSNEFTYTYNQSGSNFALQVQRSNGTDYYFYYNGSSWTRNSSTQRVRLYKLTGTTPGDDATPGLFAKITGKLEYEVERGLKAEQILALVKAEIKGYEYTGTSKPGDDVTGTDITEELEFVLDTNYDGAKAGEYAVTISYKGVTLGIAKVIVPAVNVDRVECDESATVYKNSSKRVATGASLTVKYEDGTTSTVPITVSMLKDADGNAVSTAEVGSFDVYVDYNGQKFPFTLNVVEKVINDYPEYPEPGAIRFDKTAVAQGSFSKSGIAKVELSMTGVPYGSSVPTDVVIMVDMTTSMERSGYVDDANTAIKAMLEALVYDSVNDVYDDNIFVQVWTFRSDDDGVDVIINNDLPRTNIPTEEDLKVAKDAIAFDTGLSTGEYGGSGTCYDAAAKKMYDLVVDCETENVVAVFASDGGPSRYAYLNDNNGVSVKEGRYASVGQDTWFNNDGSVTEDYLTEYYTYQLKSQTPAIPVYTVAVGIDADTPEAHVLEHMSSEYDASGKVVSTAPANATTNYFARADINSTPDSLSTIFAGIAASIREAATDVVVEDKIDSHYTMNFSLPENVTAAEAGGMDDFYIQVLGYELDDHNNRKDDPTVLEKFLFNSDGTITHTVGGNACGATCNHVTKTGGTITGIDGTYFDYKVDANGDEFLTWTAEKLDRTELALEYFVYLDKSAGFEADEQVNPGTYPTNEYATISYTNFNNKRCEKEFPIPTMTWMGAKVTYVFYLVNDNGQPVNRAGKVVPFAEAIYVTDPVTYDVTWNEAESVERLSADYLADDLVPDVYELFDEQAYYELRVYQNETENSNYFQISGADDKLIDSAMDSDTTKDNSTTKVYNTKAGTKYDKYGVYSQQAVGTVLNTTYVDENGNETPGTVTTTVKTDGIDYANTTVAFAVVWKPELHSDTVVVDYGLDVVIDVTTNDALASGVTGVSPTAPSEVLINSGSYQNSVMSESADIKVNGLDIGTAKVEDLSSVRFSLDKINGMQFTAPAKFFYESACEYYINDGAGEPVLNMAYMYSSVTVIPATTIYYEDEFVTLTTSKWDTATNGWVDSTGETNTHQWTTDGTTRTATQAQDRPGTSQISATLDADNAYGYDAAYKACSQYSLGSAAKINVDYDNMGLATFSFYGTGFDVISLTSNTTGTIVVDVYAAGATEATYSYAVDTYYGYAYGDSDKDGTEEWYPVDSNSPSALYQVPVMKISGLTYGKYTAKINIVYDPIFDNEQYGDGSYDFYLDAIRIYDPANDGASDTEIRDAYVADGEYLPNYYELRNWLITAETFNSLADSTVNGIVFIDSNVALEDETAVTDAVTDYTSYGPNNELYLAAGQGVAFALNGNAGAPAGYEVDKVQIAYKSVGGAASLKIWDASAAAADQVAATTVNTATDLYFDITAMNGKTVVILNSGASGIVSITNVKITYKQIAVAALASLSLDESDPYAVAAASDELADEPAVFTVSAATAETAVMSLRKAPAVDEPETPVEPDEPDEPVIPDEPETPVEPEEPEVPQQPSYEEIVQTVVKKVIKTIKSLLGWLFK